MSEATKRVALVTGAAMGIGKSIALRLAADGYAVLVTDIEAESARAEIAAAEIVEAGGLASSVVADVRDAGQIDDAVATAVERFGRLDLAVANAGIARTETILETTPEAWDLTFDINTRGVFFTWQAAARQFILQGGGGKLIAAASMVAFQAAGVRPVYSASKFAVRGLTQAAAQELAPHGITVNSYAPGIVNTPLWQNARDEYDELVRAIPLGRGQEGSDVAGLVSFLASADADYITGQTIISDGGITFA